MRGARGAIASALACVALATGVEAGPDRFADGPGGRLTIQRSEHPNRELLGALGRAYARVLWIVADTEGSRSWFRFAAEWDTAFVWREHWTVAATLKDGRVIEATDIYVATPGPSGIPIRLGMTTRWVDPEELERRPWRKDRAVPVFVAFPEVGIDLGDVAGVQVRKRTTTAAAPAADTGRSP